MRCPFCEWEADLYGGADPAEIVVAFDEHLGCHVEEMTAETRYV
jgi:hypothetical protein